MDAGYLSRYRSSYSLFYEGCLEKGRFRNRYVAEGTSLGTGIVIEGIGPVISFSNFDTLGIGASAEAKEAAMRNLSVYGFGFSNSRMALDSDAHVRLERVIRQFKRAEACVGVVGGYAANEMLLSLLLARKVKTFGGGRLRIASDALVCVDEFSHASIQNAVGVYRNDPKVIIRPFRHADYVQLEELLAPTADRDDFDRFIVVDSLFSVNGDFADVKRLHALARQYRAFLVIDNAHSDGGYGPQGRGVVEDAGICDPEDLGCIFQSGTFSKTLAGAVGGYVTIFSELADLARASDQRAVFSAGLPSFLVATYADLVEMIQGPLGDERRTRLARNSAFLREALKEKGFDTMESASHIIPVVTGDEGRRCYAIQDYLLRDRRQFYTAMKWPSVPKRRDLIRIVVSALHTDSHLEQVVGAFVGAREKFRF